MIYIRSIALGLDVPAMQSDVADIFWGLNFVVEALLPAVPLTLLSQNFLPHLSLMAPSLEGYRGTFFLIETGSSPLPITLRPVCPSAVSLYRKD